MGCGCAKQQDVSLPLHYNPDGVSSDEEEEEGSQEHINACDDAFAAGRFVNGYLIKPKPSMARIDIPCREIQEAEEDEELSQVELQFSPIQVPQVQDNPSVSRNPILSDDPYSMRMNSQINPTFGNSIPNISVTPVDNFLRAPSHMQSSQFNSSNDNLEVARRPSRAFTVLSGAGSSRNNNRNFTSPGSVIVSEHSTESSQSTSYYKQNEKFYLSTRSSGILSEADLIFYRQPSAFNVVIWSKNATDQIAPFKKAFYHEFSFQEDIARIKFKSFYTDSTSLTGAPALIDALVYKYTGPKDQKHITSIYTNYRFISTHILYNTYSDNYEEAKEFSESLSAILIDKYTPSSSYLERIFYIDRKMFLLIKRVFNKLDNTKCGFVTLKNLGEATAEIGCKVSELDMTQMLRTIDIDRDNRINFQEFISWWKKGRQGIMSFCNMIESWACRVSARIPGALKIISRMGMGKTTARAVKNFSLSIGKTFSVPKISFYLKINDAQSLGSILNPRANMLGFRSDEIWFAFSIKTHTEVTSSVLKTFKRSFKNYLLHCLNLSSKEELEDLMIINASKNPSNILIGLSLNTQSPQFQNLLTDLLIFDLFTCTDSIPLKGYVEIFIKSSLNKIKRASKSKFFIPILEALKANIEISHSVAILDKLLSYILQKFRDKLSVNLRTILPFILRTSKMHITFKSLEDMPRFYMSDIEDNPAIPSGSIIFEMLKNYISEYITNNSDLKEMLNICASNFESDIEVYARYKELGIHSAVYIKGVVDMIMELIGSDE